MINIGPSRVIEGDLELAEQRLTDTMLDLSTPIPMDNIVSEFGVYDIPNDPAG